MLIKNKDHLTIALYLILSFEHLGSLGKMGSVVISIDLISFIQSSFEDLNLKSVMGSIYSFGQAVH